MEAACYKTKITHRVPEAIIFVDESCAGTQLDAVA